MRREFYNASMAIWRDALNKKRAAAQHIDTLKTKIDSGNYSEKRIAELRDELHTAEQQFELIDREAMQTLGDLLTDIRGELAAEMALNGADITADAQLLPFNLSEQELVTLLRKNEKNPTMVQLILKHAKERGLDLGIHFIGNTEELAALEDLEYAIQTGLKWFRNDNFFDRVFHENKSFKQLFDVDDLSWKERPVIQISDDRVRNAISLLEKDDMSIDAQIAIIHDFEGQPGALSVLREAADKNARYAAVDEIDRMLENMEA